MRKAHIKSLLDGENIEDFTPDWEQIKASAGNKLTETAGFSPDAKLVDIALLLTTKVKDAVI